MCVHTYTYACKWIEKERGPCSLRAVKRMVPVSSPTRHSAMRAWPPPPFPSSWELLRLFFCCETALALTTLTVRVWPLVSGFKWSTFTNTGFRFGTELPPPPFAVDAMESAGDEGGRLLWFVFWLWVFFLQRANPNPKNLSTGFWDLSDGKDGIAHSVGGVWFLTRRRIVPPKKTKIFYMEWPQNKTKT